jgi:hypothetical protein
MNTDKTKAFLICVHRRSSVAKFFSCEVRLSLIPGVLEIVGDFGSETHLGATGAASQNKVDQHR